MDLDILTDNKDEILLAAGNILKKKQVKKRLISIAIVMVLILSAFGSAWLSGSRFTKEKYLKIVDKLNVRISELEDLIENPNVVNPVTPLIVLDTVKTEIQEIGELATVEYNFTNSARFSDSVSIGNWNIPFTEKSFIAKWDGRIKAGIKLEQVTVDMDEDEYRIIIHIPSAEILSYETFYDTVEILDEKDNIFNKLTIEDKVGFDSATSDEMKNRAIENGLLEKAEKNAKEIITKILTSNSIIGDGYTIEFIPVAK